MPWLDYDRLVYCWTRYQCTIAAKLYPDGVQAWGMAFAQEWHHRKVDLCEQFGIDPEEFTYSMKHDVMKGIL